MMKVLVIGATGTIGSAVADALAVRHEVIRVSRPDVDLNDPRTFAAVLDADLDAIVCCAASAPLIALSDDRFVGSIGAKLIGQVELVRAALGALNDGGSITVTSGKIPEALPGSAGGALVNAGLEAFVAAAAVETPRGLRINLRSAQAGLAKTLNSLGWMRGTGHRSRRSPACTLQPSKARPTARRSRPRAVTSISARYPNATPHFVVRDEIERRRSHAFRQLLQCERAASSRLASNASSPATSTPRA